MVPHRIIQGWIGPNPMPERERAWCAEMKRMNSGWTHVLFGNEALEKYGRDPYVKAMQDAKRPMAFIVDRIRALMLAEEGGIWLDPDCQPKRPLDLLKHIWDAPEVEFVMAMRNPHRPLVALHRGVTLCDNTIMASAPGSRMIRRILNLWKPTQIVVDGHATGVEMLARVDGYRERLLGFAHFYDLQDNPEAIVLHDPHNMGSWVAQMKAERLAVTA